MRCLLVAALLVTGERTSAATVTPTNTELVECAFARFSGGVSSLGRTEVGAVYESLASRRKWAHELVKEGYPDADSIWAAFTTDEAVGMTRPDVHRMLDSVDNEKSRRSAPVRRAVGKMWC